MVEKIFPDREVSIMEKILTQLISPFIMLFSSIYQKLGDDGILHFSFEMNNLLYLRSFSTYETD
jgi:hypothetical protein